MFKDSECVRYVLYLILFYPKIHLWKTSLIVSAMLTVYTWPRNCTCVSRRRRGALSGRMDTSWGRSNRCGPDRHCLECSHETRLNTSLKKEIKKLLKAAHKSYITKAQSILRIIFFFLFYFVTHIAYRYRRWCYACLRNSKLRLCTTIITSIKFSHLNVFGEKFTIHKSFNVFGLQKSWGRWSCKW